MKKFVSLLLAAVVIVAFALFALGSGESNESTVSNGTVDVAQNDGGTKSETVTIKVGETLTTNLLKLSYVNCEQYTGYSEYFGPKEGNIIYRLEFAAENIGSSDALVSEFDFECYADGVACEAYYSADDDLSATLSAGRKATGAVYFEVPANAQSVEVEYETDWWTDSKAIFVVK